MKKEQEVQKDNKILKLIKLFVAVTCLIASYFLVFSVKSDMQYVLWVVASGPALVGAYLVFDNWVR